jgi:DNA-directed RNA polymerase specialized sigma24 family protein
MITVSKPTAAPAQSASDQDQAAWHERFIELLPRIRRHARAAFRNLNAQARDDAVDEAVAHSYVGFARLCQLGRIDLAYATPLGRFAVARVQGGRCVGNKLNTHDVLAKACRQRRGIRIQPLDKPDGRGGWREIVVESRHAGPAQTAAARIDVAEWLHSLPERNRAIAEALAAGHETQQVARMFELSPGRISQLRRMLLESWMLYQREPDSVCFPRQQALSTLPSAI